MSDFQNLRDEFKSLLDGADKDSVQAGALRRALEHYKFSMSGPVNASWGDSHDKGPTHDKSTTHEKGPDHDKGWTDSR